MNNMTDALRVAGMTLPPLNKRVWLWLKDHPEKTYKDVANALSISLSAASGALHDLHDRLMVVVFKDKSHATKASSFRTEFMVSRYSCKHKEFELLPSSSSRKRAAAKAARAKAKTETVISAAKATLSITKATQVVAKATPMHEQHKEARPKGPTTDIDAWLKSLTVDEAVRVHSALNKIFSQFKN
jgi:hypothetical protein